MIPAAPHTPAPWQRSGVRSACEAVKKERHAFLELKNRLTCAPAVAQDRDRCAATPAGAERSLDMPADKNDAPPLRGRA